MHERSLVRALLRQVEAIATDYYPQRVRAIRLRVDELSGVEPTLLRSAYDELAEQTSLRGAELSIALAPLMARCQGCGQTRPVCDYSFRCADCGGEDLVVTSGEELLLESILIEDWCDESATAHRGVAGD